MGIWSNAAKMEHGIAFSNLEDLIPKRPCGVPSLFDNFLLGRSPNAVSETPRTVAVALIPRHFDIGHSHGLKRYYICAQENMPSTERKDGRQPRACFINATPPLPAY